MTEKTGEKRDFKDLYQELYQVQKNGFNGRFSKTALFLLPTIEMSLNDTKLLKHLDNVFLDDKGFEHDFSRPLFMLFRYKPKEASAFEGYLSLLKTKEEYKLDYCLGHRDDYELLMVVFEIPERWKQDYHNFKLSRYSRMSPEYKNKFPRYLNKDSESIVWGALHKSDVLKDRVVNLFIVKKDNDRPRDPMDVINLRREIDTWDEIWDSLKYEEEVYRYLKTEDHGD
jgi:hypothetical protein